MSSSGTVRQTVTTTTTVQQSPNLDNNLDALLEDLQTSVSRPPSSAAMNGISTPTGTRSYREVTTRTVQHEGTPGYQVQYLSAANPTTIVSERASSPNVDALQQQSGSASSYKTVSYQYNTSSSSSTQPISGLLVDGNAITSSDPTSDVRLQQNLNELDNLLVDLHQAQKAGFGTDQSGVASSRHIDSSLLEPVDHSTPTQRQLQKVTRIVQERTYVDGSTRSQSPIHYSSDVPSSPRLQPKRSSSAQRELMYGTVDSHHRTTRSPSPLRHADPSPRVPHRSLVQKDTYYETKSNTTPKQERYRDKSPSNRRLQKEMYYESSKSSSAIPPSPQHERHSRDTSPPSHRSRTSPVRSSPDPYSNQPGVTKVTTVRTYNYGSKGGSSPSPGPPVSRSGAPSPAPVARSPYPDHNTQVSEVIPYGTPTQPPGTKVTTTVRTYTYELPGQQRAPTPPYSGTPTPTEAFYNPSDRTLTYQVSSPREKEPVIETPPPTVITYKYSSHASHSTSSKFPTHPPEEQQTLLPRPFPTPSPTPVNANANSQPPKRLDDLMASFSDTEHTHYIHDKHMPPYTDGSNGVAVVPPANNVKAAPTTTTTNVSKERQRTKNVAGPPVYYPPGVELFAKKEEAMMMQSGKKESGRYEYEYAKESKSKSSSSGGAAIVPVCLPLCCGMPCVIM